MATPLSARPRLVEQLWPTLEATFGAERLTRVWGMAEIWAGSKEPALRPNQEVLDERFMPGIVDDEPWLDPSSFRFSAFMEDAFPRLREECRRLRGEGASFQHYGRAVGEVSDEAPRYAKFGRSAPGWKEFPLVRMGKRIEANYAAAPVAGRVADEVLRTHHFASQVTFLVMEPHTELPLHVDHSNFLVSCHMGLVVPERCALEVAGEARSWQEGKCIAFNNSYRHRAWNHGDEDRIVFAAHALHPELTEVEMKALAMVFDRMS